MKFENFEFFSRKFLIFAAMLFAFIFPFSIAISARIAMETLHLDLFASLLLPTVSGLSAFVLLAWFLRRFGANGLRTYTFCAVSLILGTTLLFGGNLPSDIAEFIYLFLFITAFTASYCAGWGLSGKIGNVNVRTSLVSAFSIISLYILATDLYMAYAFPVGMYKNAQWQKRVAEMSRTLDDPLVRPYWDAVRKFFIGNPSGYDIDKLFPPNSKCQFNRIDSKSKTTLQGGEPRNGKCAWSFYAEFGPNSNLPEVKSAWLYFDSVRKTSDGNSEQLRASFTNPKSSTPFSAKLDKYSGNFSKYSGSEGMKLEALMEYIAKRLAERRAEVPSSQIARQKTPVNSPSDTAK